MKHLLIFAFILIAPFTAKAEVGLDVADAYAFATAKTQKNGAVFLSVHNGLEDDFLVSAESDVAERIELHTHTMEAGVMMMREVERFDLPANGKLSLKPMGDHIMLLGLKNQLNVGETFEMTLNFKNHPPMKTLVTIVAPGTTLEHKNHKDHDGHSHDHGHHHGHE